MNQVKYNGATYSEDEVIEAGCYMARSLLSDSLETDTFSVDLISETPLTPFQRNAPLVWFHRGRQMGTYYVQTIERVSKNKYHLETTSAIGLLDQSDHNGGIYTGQTLEEVVADICTVPYLIKTDLLGTKLYGWLPIASMRANLSQVLFAIGATVKADYNGVLRIEGLWSGVSGDIPEDNVFLGDSVRYATPVTEVLVTEHQYVEGQEETTLFDGTAVEGDIVQFSEPMHSLVAQGVSILEHGANYAKISSGSGILTGKKYIHTTRVVSKVAALSDQPNTVKVESATLVSLVNSKAVADRLANYYASTETITHDTIYQSEVPGDVTSLNHPYDEVPVTACIESVDMDMSGKLRATEKLLVGYVPLDVGETQYYDAVSVLTSSGNWAVPDGVTSIRAVLIGGGQGGRYGENGSVGSRSASGGSGGMGGAAGIGGEGGKVLQGNINVTPGNLINAVIGTGGTKSASAQTEPSAGGNTTFGGLSSANGSIPVGGFTDVITGTVYAKTGDSGTKGGNGGAGGKSNASALGGQNVGAYIGGAGGGATTTLPNGMVFGHGGGGGAAVGSNGTNGGRGDGSGGVASGGAGGAGASATIQAQAQTTPGSGGNGGHGGGAGGGGGSAANPSNPSQIWAGTAGAGGAGSSGSNGAGGCVLIYYRLPVQRSNGALKDKNGLLVRDKHGRQIVM